jgi:D-alanyl-lipoteichoic acid acyltransferase DltB (MBOAT superfamily)
MFTMLIGGFWHGADWKFIFWGGAHGVLLILHKLFTKYLSKFFKGKWFTGVSWAITFFCVSLLWIPFRAHSIQETWLIYCKIFTDSNISAVGQLIRVNYLLFVLIFCGYFFTLIPSAWKENAKNKYYKINFYGKIILLALFIQIIIQVRSSSVQPFIYFQF